MRTVIFGGANSLDNYFARPDGGVDWLRWSDEAAAVTMDTWKTVDTMIMGRKTYEVARRMGPGPSELAGLKSYVFSRTLPDEPGVNIVREDVAAFVRRLKGRAGRTSASWAAASWPAPCSRRTSSIASASTSTRCCSEPAFPCSTP